jgi:methylmalonyl-CoA mutase
MSSTTGSKLFAEFPAVSDADWDAAIAKDLKGGDPNKLAWRTEDGFSVKPFYRRTTQAAGRAPLVRAQAGKWEIRAEVREADPATANHLARRLVDYGVRSLCFRGPRLEGDLKALRALLDGLPLERIGIHFDCMPGSMRTLELLEKLPKAHELAGSVACDPIAEMIEDNAVGADIFPEAAVRFQNALRLMPRVLPLVVRAERYHNAGATAAQELALSLAAASEYLAQLDERDVPAQAVAQNLGFAFGVGSSYFMEIAKFRAMRILWPLLTGAFDGAGGAAARIFARTSEWNQTVYDRYNNLLRGTTETMAAIIGGCDAVTVRPYSGNWSRPDEDALRWAVNTQLILRDEAYLDKVADPAAGSWYVEELTEALAREAWKMFQDLESEGGLVRALEKGIVQNMLRATRETRQQAVAERRRALVGTNQYPNRGEKITGVWPAPPETPVLPRVRAAWPFEAVRLRTDAAAKRPLVLLLTSGDRKMRRARAEFSANFFACAGFEVVESEAIEAAPQAGLVVLCSSDAEYPALAREVVPKTKCPVIVAGYPKDLIEDLKAAGVADFIHIRSNAAQVLARWQAQLGVPELEPTRS